MDILVDDIMRYESLAELDEMMALDTLIHGDKVENTGKVIELVEAYQYHGSVCLRCTGVSRNGSFGGYWEMSS